MVPWSVFFQTLEANLGLALKEDEDSFKMFLGNLSVKLKPILLQIEIS